MAVKTIVGRLGGVPEVRAAGTAHVAKFSVAETKRKFDRERNEWVDDFTLWHDVEAWQAADAIGHLAKGTIVIVEGEERDASYENREGQKVRRVVIRARTVGTVVTEPRTSPSGDAWAPAGSNEVF